MRPLSLAEGLVLCLVREKPTYGLVLAELLAPDGSIGQIWSVPRRWSTTRCNSWSPWA